MMKSINHRRIMFVIIGIVSMLFINAISTENMATCVAYANPPTTKKVEAEQSIGDAACLGWKEDKSTVKSVKHGMSHYIFSLVTNPETDAGYGYFRVVALNRLEFAVLTAMPVRNKPIKIVMDGVKPLAVITMRWSMDTPQIGVLNGQTFTKMYCGTATPIFEDIDNDGYYEVIAHHYFTTIDGKTSEIPAKAEYGPILAIYRYDSSKQEAAYYGTHFIRAKGKKLERFFTAHARDLIEKKYPYWLGKIENKSSPADDIKKEVRWVLEGWLATLESTQNPEKIKEALTRFKKLSYPSPSEKQQILEKLIQNGYPMLNVGLKEE
jgi:hypothetical protein